MPFSGGNPQPERQIQEVALDSTTGDFYVFNFKTDRWVAEGNVGIQKIKGGIGGIAAAILADASGGFEGNGHTKKVRQSQAINNSSIFTNAGYSSIVGEQTATTAVGRPCSIEDTRSGSHNTRQMSFRRPILK